MNHPRVSIIKLSACLSIFFIYFLSFPALAQKPGAWMWADADGNGIIEVPDLIALNTVLGDFSADDTLLYSGYPQSRFRQDLDGNGVIEVPDLIILNSWVPGDFSNRPGNPDRLLLDGATHLNLNLGDSVSLSAYALSPLAAGDQLRTGFGVIFKIDPSSTCTTAQIFGYDVAGGATINAWRSNSAYHYTLKPDAPDNGRASVRVNANGCSAWQSVVVKVYIPDDSEAGVVPGRFPFQLPAFQKFSISVKPIHDYWVEDTILRNLPDLRYDHTAIWTGTEMIMWGGFNGFSSFNTGGRYNPTTDSWTATSTDNNVPSPRSSHTAIWTGTEMIVWGGDGSTPTYKNDGGRYNPATDSWSTTNLAYAPTKRSSHTAVWSGTEMIVWGGFNYSGGYYFFNTGGRYNPATDSWTVTSTTNAPAGRRRHKAVWTDSEMIVWGGHDGNIYLNTGARYNPSADSWNETTITNAPSARGYHVAVWTGTEMIVWGGYDSSYSNTGGRYNPSIDSWTATSITNAPSARRYHTAVWTGTEMIVWGGYGALPNYKNDGGRYDPSTDSWTATTTSSAPSAREYHTAVWTGTEMIVWGGYPITDTGGRYNPSTDSWIATNNDYYNIPSARSGHLAVWNGAEMIIWGGLDNDNSGGRYNLATDSWTPTSLTNAPEGRYNFSMIWTGSLMIVWGGTKSDRSVLNSGAKYDPSNDSWTATATGPSKRGYHTTVWTGTEMIIWGGYTQVLYYDTNTGSRYNPVSDSWVATSTTNAPQSRAAHTAVWTGDEMIIWGGEHACEGLPCGTWIPLNTGGRYSPLTNSWVATSTSNAPVGRSLPTSVWTNSRMIVWGGIEFIFGSNEYHTGGIYDPSNDSWTATSTTNAPSARSSHTAVWIVTEMIVWGGYPDNNTGGRYDPSTDSWTSTTTTNAPTARSSHTAVWTGTEMIIWGGGYDTGGRYVP